MSEQFRTHIGWQSSNEIRQTLQNLSNEITWLRSGYRELLKLRSTLQYGIVAANPPAQGLIPLICTINLVSTVANANDSVTLQTMETGLIVYIFNRGANTMRIYPALGGQIEALGVNAPDTLAAAGSVIYCGGSTRWRRILSA